MTCPLCDAETDNMARHYYYAHGHVCFCHRREFAPKVKWFYKDHPYLERHWDEHGGFMNHWLTHLMGVDDDESQAKKQ